MPHLHMLVCAVLSLLAFGIHCGLGRTSITCHLLLHTLCRAWFAYMCMSVCVCEYVWPCPSGWLDQSSCISQNTNTLWHPVCFGVPLLLLLLPLLGILPRRQPLFGWCQTLSNIYDTLHPFSSLPPPPLPSLPCSGQQIANANAKMLI